MSIVKRFCIDCQEYTDSIQFNFNYDKTMYYYETMQLKKCLECNNVFDTIVKTYTLFDIKDIIKENQDGKSPIKKNMDNW